MIQRPRENKHRTSFDHRQSVVLNYDSFYVEYFGYRLKLRFFSFRVSIPTGSEKRNHIRKI